MASEFSQLKNYGSFISPYDKEIMLAGMQYIQGKGDAVRANANEYISQIVNTEIIKPEAKQYMLQRAATVMSDINNRFANADLSQTGIDNYIQGELSSILDTTVINGIAGTREYQRYREDIETIRKNNPELYSSINEWHGMQGFLNWMSDGQAGSRLNPMRYSPYVNYRANADKRMKDFIANNKGRTFQFEDRNNPGYMITVKQDELTENQIRQLVDMSMTAEERMQLQMEADYMAASNPGAFNFANNEAFITDAASGYDRQIKALEGQLAGAGGDENKEAFIRANIATLENEKNLFIDESRAALGKDYNPSAAAYLLSRHRFLDGMAKGWKYNNSVEERSKDEAYFANQDLTLKKREADRKEALLSYDIEKIKSEINENNAQAQRYIAQANGVGGNGSGANYNGPITYPGTDIPKSFNPSKAYNTQYAEASIAAENTLSNLVAALSPENFVAMRESLTQMAGDARYQNMSNEDLAREYFKQNGGASNAMLNAPGARDLFDKWQAAEYEMDNLSQLKSKATGAVVERMKDPAIRENIIKVGMGNPNVPVYAPDGSLVSARATLQGGRSYYGIPAEKIVVASALASNLADKTSIWSAGVSESGRPIPGQIRTIDFSLMYTPEMAGMIEAISAEFGETVSMDEIFDPYAENPIEVNGMSIVGIVPYREGEKKTVTFMRNAYAENTSSPSRMQTVDISGTNTPTVFSGGDFFQDRRWTDDATIKSLSKEITSTANRTIEDNYAQYWTGSREIILHSNVDDKTEAGKQMIWQKNSLYPIVLNKTQGTLREAITKNISKSEERVTLRPEVDENGKVTRWMAYLNNSDVGIEVGEDLLQQYRINTVPENTKYRIENMKPVERSISFGKTQDTNLSTYQTMKHGLPNMATKDEFRNNVNSMPQIQAISMTESEGELQQTLPGQYINEIIDNANNLSIELSGDTQFGVQTMTISVYNKNDDRKSREALYSLPVTNVPFVDDYIRIINAAPQAFLLNVLGAMGNEQANYFYQTGSLKPISALQRMRDSLVRSQRNAQQQ